MALPVVQAGYTSNTAVPGTISISMPTGLTTGDVCLILVGNDAATGADQWDNVTNKPTGFTLIDYSPGITGVACHLGAFYRVIDGSESWPISVPAADVTADMWGFAVRVTGVDTSHVVDIDGVSLDNTTNITSHVIPGVTTTVADCLAFFLFSYDGGDGDPFSVSGTGWSKTAEIEAGTGAGNAGGCWGTKDMAAAGATGDVTVTSALADTSVGVVFAIRGLISAGQPHPLSGKLKGLLTGKFG